MTTEQLLNEMERQAEEIERLRSLLSEAKHYVGQHEDERFAVRRGRRLNADEGSAVMENNEVRRELLARINEAIGADL